MKTPSHWRLSSTRLSRQLPCHNNIDAMVYVVATERLYPKATTTIDARLVSVTGKIDGLIEEYPYYTRS